MCRTLYNVNFILYDFIVLLDVVVVLDDFVSFLLLTVLAAEGRAGIFLYTR